MAVYIYRFSAQECAGNASMKALLGGKGANLAEMCQLGLPVPPGFTITTEVCNLYRESAHKDVFIAGLMAELGHHMAWLKDQFGYTPLVSVRSGAPVSMPGMMDTILNVGLTTDLLPDWVERIGVRAAFDSQRRLIQMLGSTAYGVPHEVFEFQLAKMKKEAKVEADTDLGASAIVELVDRYLHAFEQNKGFAFPVNDAQEQMRAAIKAVFDSWMNPRAIEYRKLNKIDEGMGTAVNVQAMVFGNMGEDSGTGVLFTRNPSTGENDFYGEYLINAQGEDVVAGIRTPRNINLMSGMGGVWEGVYSYLVAICDRLENHYRDMMDIEFTVQKGQLYILQCRTGKRSALAAFRIARDLAEEGLITRGEAVSRVTAAQYKIVRRPRIAEGFDGKPAAVGIGASPGVVTGKPVFTADDAVHCTDPCILITHETTPNDIAGMAKAVGILTKTGGATSHAAVVARAMDKPCVVGCTEIDTDPFSWKDVQQVTIDGETGRVWCSMDVPVVDGSEDAAVLDVCLWARDQSGYVIATSEPRGDRPCRIMIADWWGDEDQLTRILDALEQLEDHSRITLDLTPPNGFKLAADKALDECFGGGKISDLTFHDKVVQKLLKRAKNLNGLVLTGVATGTGRDRLRKAGFRISARPKTIADLLSFEAVVVDPSFVQDVIGGQEAWDELLDVFVEVGRPVKLMSPAAPAEYIVFTQLGK